MMYLSDVFTIPASLAGLPAISIPSGVTDEGLPIGMQLIGRATEESVVFRGGTVLEQLTDFQGRAVV
jgi:aspartyl-tRNA(Asn)/glutamyl-tRNA(Gln) amidotransferase subunit A